MTTIEEVADARKAALIAEANLRGVIALARSEGYSWQAIAEALGVSKQAAWERFGGGEVITPLGGGQ
jgi:DNA-directed RNA polymerase specialized sigma24 family protein